MRRTFFKVGCAACVVAGAAAVFLPVFSRGHPPPKSQVCYYALKQIGLALAQYCQDYDEIAVPAPLWGERIAPYIHPGWMESSVCPSRKGQLSYALNDTARGAAGIAARTVGSPAELLHCLDYYRTTTGSTVPSLRLLKDPGVARHAGQINCLFFDGHVQRLPPEEVARPERWTRDAR